MALTNSDLIDISARASTLAERLRGRFEPVADGGALSSRRLARWRKLSSGGDPQSFARVLKSWNLHNVSEADLLARLGTVKLLPNGQLPKWTSLLSEIAAGTPAIEAAARSGAPEQRVRVGINRAVPYAQAYWPITDLAWTRVTGVASADVVMSKRAQHGLKSHLLRRISDIASQSLHLSFLARKSFFHSGLAGHFFGLRPASGNDTSRIHAEFVKEQTRSGLSGLFIRYPVAARLISETTQHWVEFVGEFIERVQADLGLLAAHFNNGGPLGLISSIKAGVSEPHRGGRCVLLVTFQGGIRVVYKPRSVEIDRLFFGLADAVNLRIKGPKMRVLTVLDRGEYGWMEFASSASCEDRLDLERYFHRAGSLTCLVHWLRGIDFHRDNVIASGENPVLVDLEALAHSIRSDEMTKPSSEFETTLADSVLRTGLLPLWQTLSSASARYEGSGFGAPVQQQSIYGLARWKHVNTDQMALCVIKRFRSRSAHRPKLKDHVVPIQNFEDEVVAGYGQVANELNGANATELMRWRELINEATRRRIIRPTAIYGALLACSVQPDLLAHGVDRSIELEALPNALGDDPSERAAEIRSLEQMDVPYFTTAIRDPSCPEREGAKLMDQVPAIRLSLQWKLLLEDSRIRVWKTRRRKKVKAI